MRERIVKTTILLRRGTLREFTENNPLLRYGEPSFIVDIGRLKIGDGIRHWLDLPYIGGEGGGDTVQVYPSEYDLPEIGYQGILYYTIQENDLLSWNEDDSQYISVMQEKFDEILNQVHIENLLQDEYIIFDCGTSTRNI